MATVYSLKMNWAITFLLTGDASSSRSCILAASLKRSEHMKRYSDIIITWCQRGEDTEEEE
jgi:hypothetical protein